MLAIDRPVLTTALLLALPSCAAQAPPPYAGETLGDLAARISASTADDGDRDRLPDDVELELGTDPAHPDSDRDGEFDYDELFGHGDWDPLAPVPDGDGDGTISPLDDDDDGDGEHDGERFDNDGDGIANYEEYYGYVYDAARGEYRPWDGHDYSVRYFKSDPNQSSTDQDPYDDGLEASGTDMDVSVLAPGSYPMVPAFADVVVRLEGYAVTLDEEITWAEGESLSRSTTWERTVEATHQTTNEYNWGVSSEVGFGAEGISASFSASFGGSHSTTRGTSTAIAAGTSITSDENWSRSSTTNPTDAAHVKLFLRVTNHGTAVASNVVPTLTLRIGGHNVATFEPGNAGINILEPGATYPSAPGVYWVVDTMGAASAPITLTLNELRALESGAPISITMTQMSADVMQRNGETGAYESVGDWNQYLARIEPVSADLYFDIGDGNFVHSLVYAGASPTAPRVTLGDALVWAAGAQFDEDGADLSIAYRHRDSGETSRVSLRGWHFALDAATYRGNGFDPTMPLPAGTDAWDLRLFPDSTVVARPPRELLPDPDASFVIHYAFFDESLGTVNVVATDYRGIASVQFVDQDGMPSLMREVVPASSFYAYNPNADPERYPSGYVYDHSERIVVTNLDGEMLSVELAQIYLPREIVPVSPLIQNVRLDLLNDYVYAEIVPHPPFFPDWVSTFYRPDAFSLTSEIEMEPTSTWYRDESSWVGEIGCDFVVGDSRVVAYVQPGVFAERDIVAGDAVYARMPPSAPVRLGAHHDWTADDYYSINGIDFDTGLGYFRDAEEDRWDPAWDPRTEFEVWLRWENAVDWKLFFNGPAKRINALIDPACAASAEPLDCIDPATLNRCETSTDATTFGRGDYFYVETDRNGIVVFRVDAIENSSSAVGNWRHRDVTLSYRLYSNVETERVAILRALYNTASERLVVHATSNRLPAGAATLALTADGASIGTLGYEPFLGFYRGSFPLISAPVNVVVDSGAVWATAGVASTSEILTIDDVVSGYDAAAETVTVELVTDHPDPDALLLTAWIERGGAIVTSALMTHAGAGRFTVVFTHVYEVPDSVVVDSTGGGAATLVFP